MAFDKDIFRDGESTYDVPYWRQAIEYIDANVDTFSYEQEFAERRKIQEDEVGIKHPNNNSFIKIKDDGTIEAFAGDGGGFRIKPDNQLQMFGDVQIIGNYFQGITPPNQNEFNKRALDGGYPASKEKGKSSGLKYLMRMLGEENIGF